MEEKGWYMVLKSDHLDSNFTSFYLYLLFSFFLKGGVWGKLNFLTGEKAKVIVPISWDLYM